MNKFLKVMFIILIVAMSGAMIFQIFFPEVMGAHSGYGVAVGWQREIGFWNLAVLMILIAVNVKYDWFACFLRNSLHWTIIHTTFYE